MVVAIKNIPIIFEHGANQGIDKRVLPDGWFRTAQNTRFRKDGRLGKRYGYLSRAVTASSGNVDDPAQLIFTHQDTELVASDGVLWAWDGLQWTAPLSGTEPLTVISDFEPTKKTWAAVDEERNSIYPTVASNNGYRFIAWSNNAGLFVRCENEATGAVVFIQRLDGGGTATEPRLTKELSSGERVICVWRDGTSIKLLSCETDSGGSPFTPPGFTGAQTLTAGATAAAGYDITPAAGTAGYFALTYQSGANQITVAKCSSGGVASSVNFTDATETLYTGVYYGSSGGGSDNQIYVLWRVGGGAAAGFIRCRVYNTNSGASAPNNPTATIDVNTLSTNTGRPTGVHTVLDAGGTNGRSVVIWSGVVTNQPRMYAQHLLYVPGGPTVSTTSTLRTRYEHRNASKPWMLSPDTNGFQGVYVWTHVGRSISIQPGFHLYELDWDDVGRSHMREAYGSAYYQDHAGAPVQTDGGEWLWAFPEIIRGFNDGTPAVGSAILRYTHKAARYNRAVAQLGGSTYVAGGWLTQFDGRLTVEQGFAWAPQIISLTESAGGSLTATGVYQYVCVYEWVDTQGNRQQSEPSTPAEITLTGVNNRVTLAVTGLDGATLRRSSAFQISNVVLHVYRTTDNGRTFTRVTPDVGAPAAVGIAGGATGFVDDASDASILDNEGLYSQGGPLPHAAPPSCGHVWAGKTRLCISRLANRSLVQFSKIHVPGEPVQWADDDAFRALVPGDVECAAEMDGIWYVFTENEIYAVQGDGPDDKGVGDFQPAVRVPSPVGCRDWRSLVEVPQGLIFHGGPGIYLLPRGGGAPVWAGQVVRDELGPTGVVIGATYDVEENVAVLGVLIPTAAYRFLVFDIRNGEWTVDTIPANLIIQCVGSWSGRASWGATTGTPALWTRDTSLYFDTEATAISQTLETGELTPFGLDGYGRVRTLRFLGEYRTDATLTASAYFDGETTPSTASWNITAANGYVAGGRFEVQWDLPRQKLTSLSIKLVDASSTGSGEGLVFHGMTLGRVDVFPGVSRLPVSARV